MEHLRVVIVLGSCLVFVQSVADVLMDVSYHLSQTLHGTAIYAYIDPQNHPNGGIYGIHGHGVSGYLQSKQPVRLMSALLRLHGAKQR